MQTVSHSYSTLLPYLPYFAQCLELGRNWAKLISSPLKEVFTACIKRKCPMPIGEVIMQIQTEIHLGFSSHVIIFFCN